MKKITYIASGWFNPEQRQSRDSIIEACEELEISYFNPETENLCDNFADPAEQKKVFDWNVKEIENCEFVIVNTAGKDMGTIFEAGFAYRAGIPIIYYWENGQGMFNLMLAQSGIAVATNKKELIKHIQSFLVNKNYSSEYNGTIE